MEKYRGAQGGLRGFRLTAVESGGRRSRSLHLGLHFGGALAGMPKPPPGEQKPSEPDEPQDNSQQTEHREYPGSRHQQVPVPHLVADDENVGAGTRHRRSTDRQARCQKCPERVLLLRSTRVLERSRRPAAGIGHLRLYLLRALLPQLAFFFQSPEDDLIDARIHGGLRARRGEAAERQFAGEHFVNDHAEAVDVGAVVDVVRPFVLLRGHVGRATERRAGEGQGEVAPRVADDAGDPEVDDLHAALRIEQDVLGLDVAVPHALRVGRGKGIANPRHHGERLRRSEAPGPHRLAEVHAIHELHEEVEKAAAFPAFEHGDDVGMAEFSQHPRLTGEALRKGRIAAQFGRENLQRDGAVERGLPDLVDEAHAALADEFEHFELGKCGGHFLERRRGAAAGQAVVGIAENARRAIAAGGIGRNRGLAGGAGVRLHTGS